MAPSLGETAGKTFGDFMSGININPLGAPDMRTLVYSPDVRVLVSHMGTQYDVSQDLVGGTVIRKENGASTIFVRLSNKGGRYSDKIKPMDKITVFMKRIQWQQVFSGYVDTAPFRQLYQGVCTIKATCTIKRLMHTWWNPGLAESQSLFNQAGAVAQTAGGNRAGLDSGLGSILANLLTQVGGWNASNIHISQFPVSFYNFLSSNVTGHQAANRVALENFKHMLLGDDISAGVGSAAGYNASAGAPGGIGVGQAFYVAEIVAACDELGLGPRVQDLSTASALQATGETGSSGVSLTPGDQNQTKAWTSIGELGLANQQAAKNSDGAILGVACAMSETGMRNLCNPNDPKSMTIFPNDGPGFDHDSVGLFQQRANGEWGTTEQRMNPRQAARMFFNHLAAIEGWRNADPGQVIFRIQRGGSPARFSGFVAAATAAVQSYREAQQGGASTVAGTLSGVSSVAGAAGTQIATSVANTATNILTSSPDGAGVRQQLGKPSPDTEGAIQTATMMLGQPYVSGGRTPGGFDCSGLVQYAFRSIGINPGPTTVEQIASGKPVNPAGIQRGDVVFPTTGHVVIWLGGGMVLHSPVPGGVVSIVPQFFDLNSVAAIRRYGDNGGIDPTAPRSIPTGPGTMPGTGVTTGGGAGGGQQESIARNLFQYIFQPGQFLSLTANIMGTAGGHKDFIDAQPLIQMIQAVSRASLRNFQSAANGDLIFYYPDYFGLDHKPAVLRLEDIELKDVHINQSDDSLTTHVYVSGQPNMFGQMDQISQWLDTAGVASVEDEWLFARLRAVGLADYGGALSGSELMRRFGVRPYQINQTMAGSHELEFLMACQIFMEKWAEQYQTQVSFTFLPELFPGMRILLGDHNVQVYVTEVVHEFDFESGFRTSAVITAPSNPGAEEKMANTVTTATHSDVNQTLGGANIMRGEQLP